MTEQQHAPLTSVSIQLLDRDYQVRCPSDRQAALLAAAGYLDQQLRELRSSGRIQGIEKLAMTAALNMAHEVLAMRHAASETEALAMTRVLDLLAAVEGVLQENAS